MAKATTTDDKSKGKAGEARHRGSPLGRGPPQLLLHNAQAAGQLGAVGAVVAQQEGGLAVLDDILGDVHGGVGQTWP